MVKRSYCRSEEHTSELQSQSNLVCRLLLEKKKHRCPLTAHHRWPCAGAYRSRGPPQSPQRAGVHQPARCGIRRAVASLPTSRSSLRIQPQRTALTLGGRSCEAQCSTWSLAADYDVKGKVSAPEEGRRYIFRFFLSVLFSNSLLPTSLFFFLNNPAPPEISPLPPPGALPI